MNSTLTTTFPAEPGNGYDYSGIDPGWKDGRALYAEVFGEEAECPFSGADHTA